MHKSSSKPNKLWVSGHVYTRTSLSKFGFKPAICRVWSSCSLFEPLFQTLAFASRCPWRFAHPSGVACWFSSQITKSSPKLSKLWGLGPCPHKNKFEQIGPQTHNFPSLRLDRFTCLEIKGVRISMRFQKSGA